MFMPSFVAKKIAPSLPDELVEAFSETQNAIEFGLKFGTSPELIAGSEGSIADELIKGFHGKVQLKYTKALKHILAKVRPLAQAVAMGSPSFKLGMDLNLNFNYDDIADLKEHPMLSQFANMKYSDIYNMLGLGEDLDYKTDLEGLSDNEFGMLNVLKAGNQLSDILG